MKTIFTLLSSLIISAASFASPGFSKSSKADDRPMGTLTISSADRGALRVVVDGRTYQSSDNLLTVDQMAIGYHSVKVYKERNIGFFSVFGRTYDAVFNSSVSVKPWTNVTIQINRFGSPTVNETRMAGGYDRHQDNGWDRDGNYDRSGSDRDNHYGGYDNGRTSTPVYSDYGNSNVMSGQEFDRVLRSIDREWYETNKVKSATQIIQTNNLTSEQVKEMLQLFSFEDNKLDLAKLAYSKTVDKKNYFMVNDVFSFNSSRDELIRYIHTCE